MAQIESHPNRPTVAQLRDGLSRYARKLLTKIWDYQLEEGSWVLDQDLFRNEPSEAVKEVEELCPKYVLKQSYVRVHYHLTLLGILSAENGEEDAALLAKYLDYILKRYKEEPKFTHVTDLDLRQRFSIGEKDAYRMGLLVYAGKFYHWGDSTLYPKMSRISLPDDVHELQDEKNMLEVVILRAKRFAEESAYIEANYLDDDGVIQTLPRITSSYADFKGDKGNWNRYFKYATSLSNDEKVRWVEGVVNASWDDQHKAYLAGGLHKTTFSTKVNKLFPNRSKRKKTKSET